MTLRVTGTREQIEAVVEAIATHELSVDCDSVVLRIETDDIETDDDVEARN